MGHGADMTPRRRYHIAVVTSIPLLLAIGFTLQARLGPRTDAFFWSIVALFATSFLVLGIIERRTRRR